MQFWRQVIPISEEFVEWFISHVNVNWNRSKNSTIYDLTHPMKIMNRHTFYICITISFRIIILWSTIPIIICVLTNRFVWSEIMWPFLRILKIKSSKNEVDIKNTIFTTGTVFQFKIFEFITFRPQGISFISVIETPPMIWYIKFMIITTMIIRIDPSISISTN